MNFTAVVPSRRRAWGAAPVAFLLTALAAAPALAIQTCELDGKPVNPNNGAETAGKTGLMRCRDADSGAVMREQELQNGKTMGVMRYFKAGQVEREFHVNERGNRDGLSREWSVNDAAGKHVLIREENYVNGSNTGLSRSWTPDGARRRLTFYGDDARELAVAEFTPEGKLADLRCAPRPVFGTEFDDKAACGHAGAPSSVAFYNSKGLITDRVVFERGERRKSEALWDNGTVRESRELTPGGGVERSYMADGTKRHEVQWTAIPSGDTSAAGARPRRVNTLDQEFHESGKLVHERRWTPTERGADLVTETWWYLNGQPKRRIEYAQASAGKRARHEVDYFDSGKTASDGLWLVGDARGDRSELPSGVHKSFDEQGRLRGERIYDDRGRLTRERDFDEHGALVRDDEVFEDGSRKSAGR